MRVRMGNAEGRQRQRETEMQRENKHTKTWRKAITTDTRRLCDRQREMEREIRIHVRMQPDLPTRTHTLARRTHGTCTCTCAHARAHDHIHWHTGTRACRCTCHLCTPTTWSQATARQSPGFRPRWLAQSRLQMGHLPQIGRSIARKPRSCATYNAIGRPPINRTAAARLRVKTFAPQLQALFGHWLHGWRGLGSNSMLVSDGAALRSNGLGCCWQGPARLECPAWPCLEQCPTLWGQWQRPTQLGLPQCLE